MAEKGGKGFSFGKGDQDSPMNFLSQSGGKGETPIGDPLKTGKGGKNSVPKEIKYELNVQHDLPKNAQCLMDCEAADILQGIQEQMVFLSRDPTIKLPISFDRGLQYAKTGARYSDAKTVRQVLENLKKHGVSDSEICVIANANPESVDEVFALLPSLKAKRSKITEPLKDALTELINLKIPTEGLEG